MNTVFCMGILSDVLFVFLLGWCTWIDFKRREIPNTTIVLLLVLAVWHMALACISREEWLTFPASLLLSVPFLFCWTHGKIGGGDVKLLLCCGLYLGLWHLALAYLSMLPVFLCLLCVKKKSSRPHPFAPVIAFGCLTPILIKYFL